MAALRRMLKGETVTREDVGMSAGEWREFEGSSHVEDVNRSRIAAYAESTRASLQRLFSFAQTVSEMDFAGALSPEFRGWRGAGWSSTQTAYEVFQ